MITCERSDDDSCTSAKPSGGCSAKRARQADWSVLFHGLCAAVIALTVLRILPALIACLVSMYVLQSPGLRTLSSRLFRLLGLRGRSRSAEANGSNVGGGQSVSLRNQLAQPPPPPPPAPSTNGSDVRSKSDDDDAPPRPPSTNGRVALPLVRRHLRFLMSVMRSVQRFIFVRRKRSRRSSRRCRDTASRTRTVTTVTARNNIVTKTVETVTGFRTDNDLAVHCGQRYSATREQR